MKSFKLVVFGAAVLSLAANATDPDPCDWDPACKHPHHDGVNNTELALGDPCDEDPACDPGQALFDKDPCDDDPECTSTTSEGENSTGSDNPRDCDPDCISSSEEEDLAKAADDKPMRA